MNANQNKSQKKEKSPESESNTIKDYSDDEGDDILASPPSKYVARPKERSPMDAE